MGKKQLDEGSESSKEDSTKKDPLKWRTRRSDQEKKTSLGDTATIKRILDDAAIEVLLDNPDEGALLPLFSEDTSMSNLKLFVGFSAVGSSLLSHVYPAPFPRNWWCLLLCCAFYFGMSGVLQLLLSFVELESILILKARKDKKVCSVRGLNICSHFPRFQATYTLGIAPIPGGAITSLARAPDFRPDVEGGNDQPFCAQRSWEVEMYFDEEGTFLEDEFLISVQEFVQEYVKLLHAEGAKEAKKEL